MAPFAAPAELVRGGIGFGGWNEEFIAGDEGLEVVVVMRGRLEGLRLRRADDINLPIRRGVQ